MDVDITSINSLLATLATLVAAAALALHRRAASRARDRDDQLRHYRDLLEEYRGQLELLRTNFDSLEAANKRHVARAERAADLAEVRAERAARLAEDRTVENAEAVERFTRTLRIAVAHIRELWTWITVDAREHILPTAPAVPRVPEELRLMVDYDAE